MSEPEPVLRRSGGGRLLRAIDRAEPGDVFVVLDRDGTELGRAVAAAGVGPGQVIAAFDPPVQLPAKGGLYEIKRLPKEGLTS